MPEQPADPLHYEMKIPPTKNTSDTGKDSDQPRPEDLPPDSAGKEPAADGSDGKPRAKHP
jgi:hypothetical protein